MIVTNLDNFIKNVVTNRLNKLCDITTLTKALDKTFPNRWEFQYCSHLDLNDFEDYGIKGVLTEFGYFLDILIHFPEIEITNGINKHTITDLYVKLSLFISQDLRTRRFSIEGTRTSGTLSEIASQYCHSHLPGYTTGGNFDSFCLGNGPINNYLNGINRTEEEWLFFLTLLNQYVRWESIAGRPYRHLNQVNTYGELPKVPEYILNQILKTHKIKNIKYKINNNGIEVIPSEDIEEEITEKLTGTLYSEYLCYKNPDGEYLSEKQVLSHNNYLEYDGRPLFTFKGELKKFKILNERKDEQSNFTRNAPVPELTEKLCAELSNRLTKAYIKRSRIASKDTGKSAQECSREDEVLVL